MVNVVKVKGIFVYNRYYNVMVFYMMKKLFISNIFNCKDVDIMNKKY